MADSEGGAEGGVAPSGALMLENMHESALLDAPMVEKTQWSAF